METIETVENQSSNNKIISGIDAINTDLPQLLTKIHRHLPLKINNKKPEKDVQIITTEDIPIAQQELMTTHDIVNNIINKLNNMDNKYHKDISGLDMFKKFLEILSNDLDSKYTEKQEDIISFVYQELPDFKKQFKLLEQQLINLHIDNINLSNINNQEDIELIIQASKADDGKQPVKTLLSNINFKDINNIHQTNFIEKMSQDINYKKPVKTLLSNINFKDIKNIHQENILTALAHNIDYNDAFINIKNCSIANIVRDNYFTTNLIRQFIKIEYHNDIINNLFNNFNIQVITNQNQTNLLIELMQLESCKDYFQELITHTTLDNITNEYQVILFQQFKITHFSSDTKQNITKWLQQIKLVDIVNIHHANLLNYFIEMNYHSNHLKINDIFNNLTEDIQIQNITNEFQGIVLFTLFTKSHNTHETYVRRCIRFN